MYQLMTVIAQTTTEGEAAGDGAATGGWEQYSTWIFIAVFVALFYFLLIRPGQKQRKEHQQLVSSVKKGDEVVTAGGIYGRVTKVGEDYVMLEIAQKTIVRMTKSSIARVESVSRAAGSAEEPDEAESGGEGKEDI